MTEPQTPAPSFPTARHGYQRAAVDGYVREVSARVEALSRARDRQAVELRELGDALAELRTRHHRLENATLDERAQDVLDAAARRARDLVDAAEAAAADIVAAARREAEVLDERARQEYAWRRRKLAAERTELVEQQRAARLAQAAPAVDPALDGPPEGGVPLAGPAEAGRELSEQHS